MAAPLVTLTTDFGEASPYVAAMKGVLLSINPDVGLLDLSHAIGPQDVRHAAFFLTETIPYFPPGVFHVVVVDPGVGSSRAVLHVGLGEHQLLVPDNGCWTPLADHLGVPPIVRHVEERRFWRTTVSATFHGRDIFAPVAAHLSLGIKPAELGPETTDWIRLPRVAPTQNEHGWEGEIIFVDSFGNLISNIPGPEAAAVGGTVWLNDRRANRWVRSYAEAEAGTAVVLVSSSGFLEVAIVQGNAAQRFQAGVGTRLILAQRSSPPAYEV
jgi:S-adenosyl-L-methionine hydrolase (adenosine-forming)